MIDVRRYWDIARRWLWLLALGTIVVGVVAFGVSRSLRPVYRATATLLVNQAQTAGAASSYNDVLTSERLTRTYGELLRKRPIIEQVIADLNLQADYDQVVRLIEARPVRDTQLITLAAENTDAQLASDLANAVANTFIARIVEEQLGQTTTTREVLQRQITELERQIKTTTESVDQLRRSAGDQPSARLSVLQSDLGQYQVTYAQLLRSQQEMAISGAKAANFVRLAEPAVRPDRPVRPNVFQNTLLGLFGGLLLSIAIAAFLEYLDVAVKTPERVEKAAGLHTLGGVALVGGKDKASGERLLVTDQPNSPVSEAFRILRTNIEFAQLDKVCRSLAVTSPNPGEGKSTIAVNLALVIAQTGKRVVLIDADMRRPTLHQTLSIANQEGLTTLLARESQPIETVLRETPQATLKVITSGPIPPNPSELLGSERMSHVLERMLERFDLVILDTPPVLAVTDPAVIAARVDGVIVVVDSARTSIDALTRTAAALGRSGGNVLGVVLNKVTARSGGYYYYHYRDYYGDGTGPSSDGSSGMTRKNGAKLPVSVGPG